MTRTTSRSVHVLRVSADGAELDRLGQQARDGLTEDTRLLLGICGPPGAGKSEVAAHLVRSLGVEAVAVPMDGFHLADSQLAAQGSLARKGAPDTFDVWGYAALLGRLARRSAHTVYAPGFDRELEQPLAGAVAVPPSCPVVVTEGSYLLLDRPGWREVREQLDQVWFVDTDEELRRDRLVARHVRFGKSHAEAVAWVEGVDEPHARLVRQSEGPADRVLDLTAWEAAHNR